MKKRKEKSLLAVVGVLLVLSFVSAGNAYNLSYPKANNQIAFTSNVLSSNDLPPSNDLADNTINTNSSLNIVSLHQNNSSPSRDSIANNTYVYLYQTKRLSFILEKYTISTVQEMTPANSCNATYKSLAFELLSLNTNFSSIFNLKDCTVKPKVVFKLLKPCSL